MTPTGGVPTTSFTHRKSSPVSQRVSRGDRLSHRRRTADERRSLRGTRHRRACHSTGLVQPTRQHKCTMKGSCLVGSAQPRLTLVHSHLRALPNGAPLNGPNRPPHPIPGVAVGCRQPARHFVRYPDTNERQCTTVIVTISYLYVANPCCDICQ